MFSALTTERAVVFALRHDAVLGVPISTTNLNERARHRSSRVGDAIARCRCALSR